jgi:hypothetical protein
MQYITTFVMLVAPILLCRVIYLINRVLDAVSALDEKIESIRASKSSVHDLNTRLEQLQGMRFSPMKTALDKKREE